MMDAHQFCVWEDTNAHMRSWEAALSEGGALMATEVGVNQMRMAWEIGRKGEFDIPCRNGY